MALKRMKVNTVKMVLECIVVDDSSYGLEKYGRTLIGGIDVTCKLLRANCHLKNHWCWELDFRVCYCDTTCQVLAVIMESFCLTGRSQRCLESL